MRHRLLLWATRDRGAGVVLGFGIRSMYARLWLRQPIVLSSSACSLTAVVPCKARPYLLKIYLFPACLVNVVGIYV